MLATPPAFIATLAGLAMLRVLQTSFQISFRDKFSFGALICFVVTVADVPIFRIGAPFWGLVFGLAASYLLERDDLKAERRANSPDRARNSAKQFVEQRQAYQRRQRDDRIGDAAIGVLGRSSEQEGADRHRIR